MQLLAPLYSVGWHNQTRPGANEKEFRINAALDSQEAGGVTHYSEQKPQCGKLKTINPAGYKSVQYFGVTACTKAIYCIC